MKTKYYTSQDIKSYADKTGAVCTFAGLNLRVFRGWTTKGSYEVKFHRIDACTWQKKLVRK